jgi:hypothetical protein
MTALPTIDLVALHEIEKRERQWRWGRWLSVACGVVVLIAGFELLRLGGTDGQALLGSTDTAAAYRAFQDGGMAVLGILGLMVGFAALVFTFSRWKGDPRDRLLLSLVDRTGRAEP